MRLGDTHTLTARIAWSAAIVFPLGVLTLASGAAVAAAPSACIRPPAGSVATPAPALYSKNGELDLAMTYLTSQDKDKRTLYCFVTSDGIESPTLHLKPGDTLNITLTNGLAPPPPGSPLMRMGLDAAPCGDAVMDASSVNMHFHGTNTSPACHSDEVIHTLINSGSVFRYHIHIPANEPPGLYWYHPHVHGIAEAAVAGGASGALIIDGLPAVQPVVAGLPERVLVIRDQHVKSKKQPGGRVPSWDLTLNYVPIAFPLNTPAIIPVRPGRRELWRVVNASADDIVDAELKYDGVVQPVEVVGLDGVPTNSQDGTGVGKPIWRKSLLLPPGARAEFIALMPDASVHQAIFETRPVDTGPAGDNDTGRGLAVLTPGGGRDTDLPTVRSAPIASQAARFQSLDGAKITAQRTLYFSEVFEESKARPGMGGRMPVAPHPRRTEGSNSAGPNDDGPIQFYITEVGEKPKLFDPNNPPAIVTTQGAVEEWTIENRSEEVHAFHIHQIHFKLLKRNGVTLPPSEQQYLDTVQVPYWTGHGPKPSVTVLMDFRGHVPGDFVYHCHILEHEDGGMMAIIRVLPKVGGG